MGLAGGLGFALAHPGYELALDSLPLVLVVGVGVSSLVTLIGTISLKIDLLEDGLRGCDFWGRSHELKWPDMVDAERVRLLGCSYIRVRSSAPTSLWIPVFLRQQADFSALVREKAGAGNPLSVALGEPA